MAADDRLRHLPECLGPVAVRLVEQWAQDRTFFDAIAAAGARMVNFVEHRFIDIGAGLPISPRGMS